MLSVLEHEYARAVEEVQLDDDKTGQWGKPNEALGHHIVAFYARGALNLDSALFKAFWAKAPPEVTAAALEQVGHALKDSTSVSEDILIRLRSLWEWRVAAWSGSAAAHARLEAQQFAWWFASGHLPLEWATEQMLHALKQGGEDGTEFLVVETFAKLAPKVPQQALAAIRILAESAQRSGAFFYVDDKVRQVLYRAYQNGNEAVRSEARKLRDYLLALKFEQVRDIFERPLQEE